MFLDNQEIVQFLEFAGFGDGFVGANQKLPPVQQALDKDFVEKCKHVPHGTDVKIAVVEKYIRSDDEYNSASDSESDDDYLVEKPKKVHDFDKLEFLLQTEICKLNQQEKEI